MNAEPEDVHDDEWKDEVVNGGGQLVPELVAEKVGDCGLHHEAERVSRQHGRAQYWSVLLSDQLHYYNTQAKTNGTIDHPEMVSDMSRVTLNFDLSKIPLVHF